MLATTTIITNTATSTMSIDTTNASSKRLTFEEIDELLRIWSMLEANVGRGSERAYACAYENEHGPEYEHFDFCSCQMFLHTLSV